MSARPQSPQADRPERRVASSAPLRALPSRAGWVCRQCNGQTPGLPLAPRARTRAARHRVPSPSASVDDRCERPCAGVSHSIEMTSMTLDSGRKWSKVGNRGDHDRDQPRFPAMFIGTYEHTIDEKSRVTLPARFREGMGEGVVLARGLDGNVAVYP